MKRFYFTGHRTFGNRGCEAIVRSTVALLREQFGEVEVFVPSDNIVLDQAQWPEARLSGVTFVPAYSPALAKYWIHLQRLPISCLKRCKWPFSIPQEVKENILSSDMVISVGGDNYSLDYRIPSLTVALDEFAMDNGIPVAVWGASVGPFDSEPAYIPVIKRHLSRMQVVAVRETVSERYLRNNLGLDNVVLMADPAFTLIPEAVNTQEFMPDVTHGVIGVNVSPLIERYALGGQDIRLEVAAFIRRVVEEKGMSVLLVPHVGPLDQSAVNSDHAYMLGVLESLKDLDDKVKIMPAGFNAAQLKHAISELRYFIGARTHATIAALSSGVPTVSIAYSVKAKGINHDLFGNADAVLETPSVTQRSLWDSLEWLIMNDSALRSKLSQILPETRNRACTAAAILENRLNKVA